VEAFIDLVRSGFYDNKTFHRVIPGFLIQGGCPKGDGTGIRPDHKLLPAEFNNTPFRAGTLAMAHKPSDRNSASCQFFITLSRLPELDGQYTVIGQASDEESLRTLNELAAEPTDKHDRPRHPLYIRSITLVDAELPETTHLEVKPSRNAVPTTAPTTQPASAHP
jgi:peptidyl-prolyl cis-trans isomerase B (cyclophilin B)